MRLIETIYNFSSMSQLNYLLDSFIKQIFEDIGCHKSSSIMCSSSEKTAFIIRQNKIF